MTAPSFGPPAPEPPNNVQAEQAVLGSILVSNRTLDSVRHILRPESFYEPAHGRVYEACVRLHDAGRLADPITLRPLFEEEAAFRPLGGANYLGDLARAAESIVNATHYARQIAEMATKRKLAVAAEKLNRSAMNGASAADAYAEARSELALLEPELVGDVEAELQCAGAWMEEPPARAWVVEHWLPQGEVILLGGAGGVGKSLLAQQLLASSATGRPWMGLETAEAPALGLMCEDDLGELQRRQRRVNEDLGVSPADLAGRLFFWPRRGRLNLLMQFSETGIGALTPFCDQLVELCKRRGVRLVVLDTLAHIYGGNENARPQVTQFVSGCLQRLAEEIGGTVVVCAHPSRAGMQDGTGLSGSTAWEGSVRSRLYLSRPEGDNGNGRVLSRKKANYAGRDETIDLVWDRGILRRPEDVMSCASRPPATQVFINLMRLVEGQGRHVSAKPKAGNYAPPFFARMPEAGGFNASQLEKAMEQLFSSGRLRISTYKDPARRELEEISLVGG